MNIVPKEKPFSCYMVIQGDMEVIKDWCVDGIIPKEGDVVEFVCIKASDDQICINLRVKEV